MSTEIKRHT